MIKKIILCLFSFFVLLTTKAQEPLELITYDAYICEFGQIGWQLRDLYQINGGVRPYKYKWTVLKKDSVINLCSNFDTEKILTSDTVPYPYISYGNTPFIFVECDFLLHLKITDSNGDSVSSIVNIRGAYPYLIILDEKPTQNKQLKDSVLLTNEFYQKHNNRINPFIHNTYWISNFSGKLNHTEGKDSVWVHLNNLGVNTFSYIIDDTICDSTKVLAKRNFLVFEVLNVNELDNEEKIKIFPNPAKSYINIQSRDFSNSQLRLLSSNGKEVISKPLHSNSETIDISHLSNGIYFYKIQNKESLSQGKLIIFR